MNAPRLVTVRPGLTLTPAAAASWVRMETELGRRLDVNRSYADWDTQYAYWVQWEAFSANPTAWRRRNPGKADPPLALHPASSWHCKGLAVDTDDDRVIRAMPAYGWRFVVPTEKWHAQYYEYLDLRRNTPADSSSKPLPTTTPDKDEDMEYITYRTKAGDRVYVRLTFDDAVRIPYVEAVAWNAARGGGARFSKVTDVQAHDVLEGVRAARRRRLGMISDAVAAELDAMLAGIGEVKAEAVPDDDDA